MKMRSFRFPGKVQKSKSAEFRKRGKVNDVLELLILNQLLYPRCVSRLIKLIFIMTDYTMYFVVSELQTFLCFVAHKGFTLIVTFDVL